MVNRKKHTHFFKLRLDAVSTLFDFPKIVRSESSGVVKRKSPKKIIASTDVQLQKKGVQR